MTSLQVLFDALQAAEHAIENATDRLHYDDGLPVTYLESREIEDIYFTLCSVLVQICEALRYAQPGGGQ